MSYPREDLRARLREAMLAALPDPADQGDPELARFHGLLRAYPERSGKALRGLLLLASAEAHGGDPEGALPAAAGLELFQNWVLVHDDVEDGSEVRRGAPALHRQVGEPLAINVGDALHVYMWEHLLAAPMRRRDEILREFARTIHRTAEGQHLDLAWVHAGRFDVSEAEYLAMVRRKTAYYTVVAPLRLGAWCAGREPDPRLEAAGLPLGAAFQIRDDVLSLLPPERTEAYGKDLQGDLVEAKRTLVLAHAFAHATPAEARRLRALLARPRAEKDEACLAEALDLLRRHGSLHYAQRRAEALADEGLAALDEILPSLPDAEAAGRVRALVGDLAARPG